MLEKRKKILFLSSWYPCDFNPTNGNFVQKHAESVHLNNDVVVLSVFSSLTDKKIRVDHSKSRGVNEIIVYYPKSNLFLIGYLLNLISHMKAFQSGYRIAKSLLGEIQLIHLNVIYPLGFWAYILKNFKRIPYVVTEHSTQYHLSSDRRHNSLKLLFARIVLRNASYVLPVSNDLGNNLRKLANNAPYEVISNVVDDTIFNIKETQGFFGKKRFIHISTVNDKHKNVSGIIRVLAELEKETKDFHLDIVSDGNFTYLVEMVNKLKINDFVTFHSTKTTEEIAHMIQQSDALLLFSNYENFPCVIAEAMMCGIPVISTNVNGIPEHVNSESGILVDRGDAITLKKVLAEFISDKYFFDKNIIRNYALKNFSYQSVSLKFSAIYSKVLYEIGE